MDGSLARSLAREAKWKQMGGCVRRRVAGHGYGERMSQDSQDEMISLEKTAHVSSDCGIIPFY
jgi:hypothetical protein